MPTINISPKVRFVLYLLAVLGGVAVQYAIDKAWFGDAEFRLWSGIATLLMLLAAAKTNLTDSGAAVTGVVVSETGESGTIEATLEPAETERALPILGKAFTGGTFATPDDERNRGDHGRTNMAAIVVLAVALVVIFTLLGAL